jgi:hypothetical protein
MVHRPWILVTVLLPSLWLGATSCSLVNSANGSPSGTAGAGAAQGGAAGAETTTTSSSHSTTSSTTSNAAGNGGAGGDGGLGGQGGSPQCGDPSDCPAPGTCQVAGCVGGQCTIGTITQCVGADGCCPQSCTHATDSDCSPVSVTFGYATEFTQGSSHSTGFLLGNRIAVTQPIMLTHLGQISKQNGPNVNMGLYTDSNGAPSALVATTGAVAVTTGVMEVAVTNVALAAGNYWFMAVYSASASVGIQFNVTSDVVDYVSFPFSATLPASYPGGLSSYTGQGFNYYVRGEL